MSAIAVPKAASLALPVTPPPSFPQQSSSTGNLSTSSSSGAATTAIGGGSASMMSSQYQHQQQQGVSPNVSEDVRSSTLRAGQFVTYSAKTWAPVDDLFDYEDFVTEDVYLLLMQPSSSAVKHGRIYLWIGGESGWGEEESLAAYDAMVRENLQPAVTELLKTSTFKSSKVQIVHDAQEPDEFVSLF
jgi:hypothetical protein